MNVFYRAIRKTYGDNVIGYVSYKEKLFVHFTLQKNYSVQLIYDEAEEKVLDVVCNDWAALSGID